MDSKSAETPKFPVSGAAPANIIFFKFTCLNIVYLSNF